VRPFFLLIREKVAVCHPSPNGTNFRMDPPGVTSALEVTQKRRHIIMSSP
jgi:hypothetical protein